MAEQLIFLSMLPRFLQHLSTLGLEAGERALIAVSGGSDSVALLDLLVEARQTHGLDLVVAHVDHGISPESATVASMVEDMARSYGLRCLTTHLALGPGATETLAREARYAWLEEIRAREEARYVLTAHHADDQSETVLLRVFHGSGPAGLEAMRARRGALVRPLLPFKRSELRAYVHQRRLRTWEDPANEDPRHLRSWIRSSLFPVIRERLPGVDEALLQVARQAAQDREAWDRAIDLLPGLDWKQQEAGGSVAVAPLAGYDSTLAQAVLRACARRVGCRMSRERARRAGGFLRTAESGSRLELGNGWLIEIVFDRAHLVRPTIDPSGGLKGLRVEGNAGDGELGCWRLSWRSEKAPPLQERDGLSAWFIPQALDVRPWAAGDKVHPLGGRGRRLVVRCFQDARVARHRRVGWPMVMNPAGEIIWVPGVCRSNRLVPPAGAEALRVDAQVV